MAVKPKESWKLKLASLVAEAKRMRSREERVDFLAMTIRNLETTGNRSFFIAAGLKIVARQAMDSLGIDEKHVGERSFIRVASTYKLPNNEAGQEIRRRLVKKFGAKRVNELITLETVIVPATTKTIYHLDESLFDELSLDDKRKWARTVDKRSVTVDDPPERAKKGRPRQKRKGDK